MTTTLPSFTDATATAPAAVPFLDLRAQYLTIKPDIRAGIEAVLESGAYAGGPFVQRFEETFAPYCGCEHAVGVGNGTEALWAALLALGVRAGDEVITTPNTFIATAEAITFSGARPVFVDVDPQTYNLDPSQAGSGHHAAHQGDRAGAPVWPDG